MSQDADDPGMVELRARLRSAEADIARLNDKLTLTMSAATYGYICLNQLNNPAVKDRVSFENAVKKMSNLLDQVLSMQKDSAKEDGA